MADVVIATVKEEIPSDSRDNRKTVSPFGGGESPSRREALRLPGTITGQHSYNTSQPTMRDGGTSVIAANTLAAGSTGRCGATPASPQFAQSGGERRNGAVAKPSTMDPLSHRIIEKRRRDRMNNCLADLSRLIPTSYLKKGRGRIEKTEIIEMAIKYIKHLQTHPSSSPVSETCGKPSWQERTGREFEQFITGYHECIQQAVDFLNECDTGSPSEILGVRLMNHLVKQYEKIVIKDCSCQGNRHSGSGDEECPGGSSLSSNCDFIEGNLSQLPSVWCQDFTKCSSESGDKVLCPSYRLSVTPKPVSDSSCDSTTRQYKFKSSMKHRFSVDLDDHLHEAKKQRRSSEPSCGNYSVCEKNCFPHNQSSSACKSNCVLFSAGYESSGYEQCRRSSYLASKPVLIHSSSVLSHSYPLTCRTVEETVPIFVLNQNGNFYIPMTIDKSLVSSALTTMQEVSPVLHPVSIYVNFCAPCTQGISVSVPAVHSTRNPVLPVIRTASSSVPNGVEDPVSECSAQVSSHKFSVVKVSDLGPINCKTTEKECRKLEVVRLPVRNPPTDSVNGCSKFHEQDIQSKESSRIQTPFLSELKVTQEHSPEERNITEIRGGSPVSHHGTVNSTHKCHSCRPPEVKYAQSQIFWQNSKPP